jgi:hypothetical protein
MSLVQVVLDPGFCLGAANAHAPAALAAAAADLLPPPQTQVLFKYCPTELLDNNYRRQLVLEEVLRYQVGLCLGFFDFIDHFH